MIFSRFVPERKKFFPFFLTLSCEMVFLEFYFVRFFWHENSFTRDKLDEKFIIKFLLSFTLFFRCRRPALKQILKVLFFLLKYLCDAVLSRSNSINKMYHTLSIALYFPTPCLHAAFSCFSQNINFASGCYHGIIFSHFAQIRSCIL